jgi:hypothetical protein
MNIQTETIYPFSKKWIGLANVIPHSGNNILGNASGAFVACAALANSPEDFGRKIVAHLHEMGFSVEKIEDIETIKIRRQKVSRKDGIDLLSKNLSEENPIALDIFNAYIK